MIALTLVENKPNNRRILDIEEGSRNKMQRISKFFKNCNSLGKLGPLEVLSGQICTPGQLRGEECRQHFVQPCDGWRQLLCRDLKASRAWSKNFTIVENNSRMNNAKCGVWKKSLWITWPRWFLQCFMLCMLCSHQQKNSQKLWHVRSGKIF